MPRKPERIAGTWNDEYSLQSRPVTWSDKLLDHHWFTAKHHVAAWMDCQLFLPGYIRHPVFSTGLPVRNDEPDFAQAYPSLAPYYPIPNPSNWLDPWLLQDYHGYWW